MNLRKFCVRSEVRCWLGARVAPRQVPARDVSRSARRTAAEPQAWPNRRTGPNVSPTGKRPPRGRIARWRAVGGRTGRSRWAPSRGEGTGAQRAASAACRSSARRSGSVESDQRRPRARFQELAALEEQVVARRGRARKLPDFIGSRPLVRRVGATVARAVCESEGLARARATLYVRRR